MAVSAGGVPVPGEVATVSGHWLLMPERSSQCSEFFAKVLTRILVGDSQMSVKDSAGNLVPLFSLFTVMTVDEAREEYEALYEIEEHKRPREMVRRLGLDAA